MAPLSACIAVLTLASCAAPTAAGGFMHRADTQEEVEASLLAGLAGTMRPSATKDHIVSLETALRPMFSTVPQEADGTLRHTVVRYVLHRFFVQRGWFIRGLEPNAKSSSAAAGSGSLQDLQEWVPSYLQNFLEQIAGGRGISLRELAVLAATLEDLIHKETISRLDQAFSALELPRDEEVEEENIPEVLEVFMMIYQLGGNFSASTPAAVRRTHSAFTKQVKDWTEVQEWMRGVQKKVYPSSASLDFDSLGRVVEEIGAKYGTYNKKECATLKSELLDVESQKAGRVRLADFYNKGLTGVFQFNEKIDYLRVLGALDESDPKQPHVIVSNYVSSRPNCLKASNFYVVCCPNECEDLMGKLENAVGTEMATPAQILQLVSALSSDTVPAPRKLSTTLSRRLHSIAESNDGQVPLHGRLFAQWMHHAFPRECPYPHEEGSINPQTPNEWMQGTGQETAKASTEEMMAHVNGEAKKPKGAEARKHHNFAENELPWSGAEHLLSPNRGPLQPRSSFRTIAVFAILFSMASGVAWASKPLLSGEGIVKASAKGGVRSTDFVKDACKLA